MHNYLRTRLKYFVYLLTFGVFWINALEKPVFLWDVDDVLMQRTHTLHAIYSYPHKWQALRKTSGAFWKDFWNTIYPEWRCCGLGRASGQRLYNRALAHGNEQLADWVVRVADAKKPIVESVAILQDLWNQGHRKHYIGSNMGHTFFYKLLERDDCSFFKKYFDLTAPQLATVEGTARGEYKPDPRYFEAFLRNNNLNAEQVLFIDDRIKNVESAAKLGMRVIHFTSSVQLRETLKQAGLLADCGEVVDLG